MHKAHSINCAAYHLLIRPSIIVQESELCSRIWRGLHTADVVYCLNAKWCILSFQSIG